MFGRRQPRNQPPAVPPTLPGLHTAVVPVADPDTAAISRERALRAGTGRMMQGQAGYVVDYDRGDPEHSYTRVLNGAAAPAGLYRHIGVADAAYLTQSEIYDLASTDPELTAYQVNTLARISR